MSSSSNKEESLAKFQFRALFRKTLAYQRRQTFVNVCCVVICPFLMVALAGALAIILENLRQNTLGANPIVGKMRYCSRNGLSDDKDVPIVFADFDKKLREKAFAGTTTDVKYFQYYVSESGRQTFKSYSCAHVLDDTYPESSHYFLRSSLGSRDPTFYPNPVGGWYNFVTPPPNITVGGPTAGGVFGSTVNVTLFGDVTRSQKFPWWYIFAKDGLDVGFKDQAPNVNSASSLPTPGTETNKAGLLGNVPSRYYRYSPNTFVQTDFFIKGVGNPSTFMLESLLESVQIIEDAFMPTEANTRRPLSDPAQVALEQLSNLRKKFPAFGAIHIDDFKQDVARLAFTVQADRVARLVTALSYNAGQNNAALNPEKGLRLLSGVAMMANALLATFSDFQISHSYQGMPDTILWDLAQFPVDIGVLLGQYTYPFALTFLLPIFVLTLVKEKEDRILIMMRMHGLSTFQYYLSHYLHFMALQLVSSMVFYITGVVFGLKIFMRTDPGVIILLLILWANAMVILALVLSLLFNKSRFALIMSFVIVVLSAIINSFSNIIFNYEIPPVGWFVWPLFAFFETLAQIGNAAGSQYQLPYRMSDVVPGDVVSTGMSALVISSLVLLVLLVYLNQVLPSEFGVRKPWYFIFTEPYDYFKKKRVEDIPSNKLKTDEELYKEDKLATLEDDDAAAERKRVNAMNLSVKAKEYPLIIRNIRKQYGSGKIANKSMCLAVEENTVFGLLGPNGAGKSTLISMMTGLYPPTNGTAYVAGFDIRSQMDQVYRNIGVCPQHDILWDDLTCGEHILFYARLRGCPPQKEQDTVKKALSDVNLLQYENRLSKTLSGGEKRRLSIAIAMGGTSSLVYLDEPTTGLDPEVRRVIWDIIQRAKRDKTILLTTHSMEEADILSTRIGIMALGVLRCVGTPLHLKRKYGRGFKLTLSFYKESDRNADMLSRQDAFKFIETEILPIDKWRKIDQAGITGSATYEFDDDGKGVVSKILDLMEEHKVKLGVEDWGISQTSLEEVFLNIVKDGDADAIVT